jgi:excisionase family DNA binding protein
VPSQEEFFSFEEALDELRLKEEELKRLVSEGEIRAFREGETMKLRKSDVESLRSELSGGEIVDLGDASEELVFEDDADLGAGMATEEISEADTILEDDVPDVGEVELEDEDESPRGRPAVTATSRRAQMAATEEETEGMGLRLAMFVTSFLLLLSIPVALEMSSDEGVGGIARGVVELLFQEKMVDVPGGSQ